MGSYQVKITGGTVTLAWISAPRRVLVSCPTTSGLFGAVFWMVSTGCCMVTLGSGHSRGGGGGVTTPEQPPGMDAQFCVPFRYNKYKQRSAPSFQVICNRLVMNPHPEK